MLPGILDWGYNLLATRERGQSGGSDVVLDTEIGTTGEHAAVRRHVHLPDGIVSTNGGGSSSHHHHHHHHHNNGLNGVSSNSNNLLPSSSSNSGSSNTNGMNGSHKTLLPAAAAVASLSSSASLDSLSGSKYPPLSPNALPTASSSSAVGVVAAGGSSSDTLVTLMTRATHLRTRVAQYVEARFPYLNAAFWACMAYSVISVSMIIVNKLLLTTYNFKYPMVLLFHQNLMTVNSLYVASRMGVITYEPLDRTRVIRWLPMDVFFVCMLLTGFYSVQMLSVPMITIFKNTNNIFIAIGDAALFSNIPSRGVIGTMLLMLLAALMAALNDMEYTYVGYVWTFANCLFSTAFVLYAQSAMANTKLSTFGKMYYNNVLALPLVLVADVVFMGDFFRLLNEDSEIILSFLTWDFVFIWILSGLLGFLQSLTSLKAQHLTSPTTYSMVGALNKIPLTFIGVIIFHSPMSPKGVLYVSLSIIAGGLYSYTKSQEEATLKVHQIKASASTATIQERIVESGRSDEE